MGDEESLPLGASGLIEQTERQVVYLSEGGVPTRDASLRRWRLLWV